MNVPQCFRDFKKVYCVDTEYRAVDGEPPEIRCIVVREIRSGRTMRLWADDLANMPDPPFSFGPESLVIVFAASAECTVFEQLDWGCPTWVLDLAVEFRRDVNGEWPKHIGITMLGAMKHYKLPAMKAVQKTAMRDLILEDRRHFNDSEREAVLDYCEDDVDATADLFGHMVRINAIDLPRALHRGDYAGRVVTSMVNTGIPIDTVRHQLLADNWDAVRDRLTREVDRNYGVYRDDGNGLVFSKKQLGELAQRHGLLGWWPRTRTGQLSTSSETLFDMSAACPALAELRDLVVTLNQLRSLSLIVGSDGRNRCYLYPFKSVTGRNQPSNSRFLFGASSWLRGLAKPDPGRFIAYIDYSQQEFAIAAKKSGDPSMLAAYESGDPYTEFGKRAGIIPPDGTKHTHKAQRDRCKAAVLGIQYGMGARTLSHNMEARLSDGEHMLRGHRFAFPRYHQWQQEVLNQAQLERAIWTEFGWRMWVTDTTKQRTITNFPMQATGAEMLRAACQLATLWGVNVAAPVHDAILIEGAVSDMEHTIHVAQHAMAEASRFVLDGFEVRTDVEIVKWPDRYADPRGVKLWAIAERTLADLGRLAG